MHAHLYHQLINPLRAFGEQEGRASGGHCSWAAHGGQYNTLATERCLTDAALHAAFFSAAPPASVENGCSSSQMSEGPTIDRLTSSARKSPSETDVAASDAAMQDVDVSEVSQHDAVEPPSLSAQQGRADDSVPGTHERSRSHEHHHNHHHHYEITGTAPTANAAVDKLSRIELRDPSDTEQVHSPRSSAASQRKRSRSTSPSRDTKVPHGARPAPPPISLYVANSASLVLTSKTRHRPLATTRNGAKPVRKPLATRSTTFPARLSNQHIAAKSISFEEDAQPSWDPQVRAPAYAGVNLPQLMPSGFGLATLPRYDMVLQPKSSPLTQQQLGAEVKGIYAGLVMVEAKCITMDNARAADPKAEVSKEDWQTLIALHRTLLYEHHDFLMATQHPSANPALRRLASKYCMPARMWKHGIHAFLEVLRHRRPQSQEYMLTFIYLAYQMMCLLFDTVQSYLDTWIECLGDLARYRMAIEEDKEIHAVWCSVAARWYQLAADRHPRIGRLYHHLGILERPSLRKLYYYARSLTSVIPFINAAESLATLCAPILQDDKALRYGSHSAEAMTIYVHARAFTSSQNGTPSKEDLELIARDCSDAHELLKEQTSGKIASYGVALAVTNIAALFQYGVQQNVFRIMYTEALAREAHNARPTVQAAQDRHEATAIDASVSDEATHPLEAVVDFWASCFNSLIDSELNQATLRDLMQFVHVNLVWISSLINLRDRLKSKPSHVKLINDLFHKLDWKKLATFLNAISQIDPITQRVEEHAIHNIFLMPDLPAERRPLVEDYMLRGIVWAENYPSPELFFGIEDDDGSRLIETPARLHLRAERVLWLACLVAQPVKQSGLRYDRSTQRFVARIRDHEGVKSVKGWEMRGMSPRSTEVLPARTSSPSSTTDGFEIVSMPQDAQSLSSMGKSCVSSGAVNRSSGKGQGEEFGSSVRIEGDIEMVS